MPGMYFSGAWFNPKTEQFYKSPRFGEFEAQIILPEDISAIEAKVILEEVLGLARQTRT